MSKSNALIVFVKKPIAGHVKTRLAFTIGDEDALKVYIYLQKHLESIIDFSALDVHVFYDQPSSEDEIWRKCKKISIQEGEDLGEKMSNAFEKLFSQGYKKVCIVGSDCRDINSEDIDNAFELLTQSDLVIGPALDGGYYLLGMKKHHSFPFNKMTWSTSAVFSETIQRINNNNLTVERLRTLSDVDYEEDFPDYKKYI